MCTVVVVVGGGRARGAGVGFEEVPEPEEWRDLLGIEVEPAPTTTLRFGPVLMLPRGDAALLVDQSLGARASVAHAVTSQLSLVASADAVVLSKRRWLARAKRLSLRGMSLGAVLGPAASRCGWRWGVGATLGRYSVHAADYVESGPSLELMAEVRRMVAPRVEARFAGSFLAVDAGLPGGGRSIRAYVASASLGFEL